MVNQSREWSQYYCDPELHELEVLHARFVEHRFSRHAHDYFVIGLVESGVQAYTYRGARHTTPAGQIFVVNPAEIHTGEAAIPEGYVYRTVYPRTALMEQVAGEQGRVSRLPFFREAVIDDKRLAFLLARFHQALAERRSKLEVESCLFASLARIILRHADSQFSPRLPGRESGVVKRARDYIEANYSSDISLSDIARVVSLSPSHVARSFEKETGLPPHVYLDTVRIRRARELLDRRTPIVDVSLAVGYADQSHFTHRFKSTLGITPGQYIRGRKIRQDEPDGHRES